MLFHKISDIEYAWKKKSSAEKFVKDIRRVWKYYLIYVNIIPG